jgi:predicted kinase
MPRVLILKGYPASGKSTFSKKLVDDGWVRVNKDDLRAMTHNSKWSSDNERFIVDIESQIIQKAVRKGLNVVVDSTNLHPKNERRIRSLVGPDVRVEVKFFDVDVEECIRRDKERAKDPTKVAVGEAVIRRMAKEWESWKHLDTSVKFQDPEHIEWDASLPVAILVDLDGTLAHNDGHRGWYEYKKCIDDTIITSVEVTVQALHDAGYTIIVASGRDEECRKECETWLAMYGIKYEMLLMRTEGDQRKDSIVKRELFDQYIRGKYNILFCLDDRNQVVDMYRQELGLTVFQVADGAF